MRRKEWVAVILAVALAVAVNLMIIAILWTAVTDQSNLFAGLSENATQVLTGVFSGIVGILGAYLGIQGKHKDDKEDE